MRKQLELAWALTVAVLFLVATVHSRRAEGAMDRSAALVGAQVFQYANYLYLSELFGKPTAIPLYDSFCGDVLNAESLQAIAREAARPQDDFWKLRCSPVGIKKLGKNADGSFDLVLTYLELRESQPWIEQFKRSLLGGHPNTNVLIPEDRQLQLVQKLQLPKRFFETYSRPDLVQYMFASVGRISNKHFRVERTGAIVTVSFTHD